MVTPTRKIKSAKEYHELPFTIIVDSREQHPYSFQGLRSDADKKGLPLVVPVEVMGLKTGDYSIQGMTDRIAIERKSLEDLYSTISQRRDQFEAEMERLASMECAAVVIEGSLSDICYSPPEFAKISPKIIYRTWISWQHRWGIPWHCCDTRSLAERTTFRILNWFWGESRKRG